MRTITMSVPSMTIRMTLWEGTEDEEQFVVRGLKSEAPYVKAYGIRYPLNRDERKHARELMKVFSDWREPKL